MDQEPLVNESIAAGADYIARFDQYAPVKAAFWLKRSDAGGWALYLASDAIDDSNRGKSYGEVLRLTQAAPTPYLDPFQIKLISGDHPLASAVLAVQRRYPGNLATRYGGSNLGGVGIDGAYLYPLSVVPNAPAVPAAP